MTKFYFDYEIRIFSWHIWNDNLTKMIVLPLFQFATRLNSQNSYETEIHNEFSHINLYKNSGNSNWHTEVSTHRNWSICLYFSSINHYWPPNTRKSLVQTSWIEMERCKKRAFQLFKMRKMNFSWNIKSKYETDIFLSVRSSSMKYYTCH